MKRIDNPKLIKSARAFAGILLFFCFLTACSSGRYTEARKTIETKNWIRWSIGFKPGTSEEEKVLALGELQQYIFEYINKADPSNKMIASVSVLYHINYHNPEKAVILEVDIQHIEHSTGALSAPRPKSGPGRHEVLTGIMAL